MNKKDVILFASIFCMLALIVGGTYAYWQWESADENDVQVIFNTMKGIDDYIYYSGGESHFVGNFNGSSNHCGGKGNTLEFYVKNDAPADLKEKDSSGKGIFLSTIKMDINHISSAISGSSYVNWAITGGGIGDCTSTTLASGSFSGKSAGSQLTLLANREIFVQSECSSSKLCKYTVWVWVQNDGVTSLKGESIDVNMWTQIDMSSAD